MENRPKGRQTHVTGQGNVQRRGEGLNTGPVGNGPRGQNSPGPQRQTQTRSSGRRSPIGLIIILAIVLFGGGGGLMSMLGGNGSSTEPQNYPQNYPQNNSSYNQNTTQSQNSSQSSSGLSSIWGSSAFFNSSNSTGWSDTSNTGSLDTSVISGARAKRTQIAGGGKDDVTIMIYMCGADLESRGGMASSDIQEIVSADISDKVNIILYTGGASNWKNSVVSSSVNQIYQLVHGGLKPLVKDAGTGSMTDPSTLREFIMFCKKNFPANRNELIFWDHGGGSISGFGYDEKDIRKSSMTLAGIDSALANTGVNFDFIGFDACLMATVENGLMLDKYADYLIASEETEPGVGWYYTDWVSKFSANTSMSTLEIGKNIADDFVSTCARKCQGQKTTLSVVDLAELSAAVPDALTDFAKDTCEMIQGDDFKTVSDARYGAREFAQSSQIDQVDLVDFAKKLNTKEADALADAVLGAVKYNKTSSNMTNAYGLSIYFPYRKTSKVDSAVNTYNQIGMDDDYSLCIKQFASLEVAGQAAGGGSTSANPFGYLLGGTGQSSYGNSSNTNTVSGTDAIFQLLGSLMSGQSSGISGLNGSNMNFFTGRSLEMDQMAEYVSMNQFDPSDLVWTENSKGQKVLKLTEDKWSLVQDLCLSAYYDDGDGYVDLGLDNVFDFDDDGNLIGDINGSWLAVNGQPVAYYYDSYIEDGDSYTISGHIPAKLNGERVDLQVVFDETNEYGYIAGAVSVYDENTTDTIAKSMTSIEDGDEIDFLCDFYDYDGNYQNSYYLGNTMTVRGELEISNVQLDKTNFLPMYRFTDIYRQIYWTDVF